MLEKIVAKKAFITIILSVEFFAFWLLYLILGDGADKVMLLVLSLVMPIAVYGFVRLMYRIVGANAYEKAMRVFFYFFLIMGVLVGITMIAEYLRFFPNGMTVALGICGALIIATLDEAKKRTSAKKD